MLESDTLSPHLLHPSLCLALLLAGCRRQELPQLPAVELNHLTPAVRAALEPAILAAVQNPLDAAAVARFGMALHAHGQFPAAATAYRRAGLLDSSHPDYPYYLGTVLAATGNYAEAVTAYRAALQLRSSIPVRLALATSLYSSGHGAEALREYDTLLATDSGLAAAWYGRGLCQDGEDAAKSFRQAIAFFPGYGAARFALAGIYRKAGQKSEANAALENYERDKFAVPPVEDPAIAAVQALDSSPAGLLRVSQTLERSGHLAEAAQVLERALISDPNLTQGLVNLIAIYGSLGQPDQAEQAYRKAIAAEPLNAGAHYNYGVLSLQRENLPDARSAFTSAIRADPNYAEALDSLGAIVETSSDLNGAATLFRRAIAAKPSLRLAHFHLGRILANQRRYPEAIAEFNRSLEPADSQTPGFLYALGATRARSGDRRKALEDLTGALEGAIRQGQRELATSVDRDLKRLRAQAQ